MKILKECNFCGSHNSQFLFSGTDTLHGIPGQFNLFKCKNCSLMFLNPQPSLKELEKYYPSNYYSFSDVKKHGKKINLRMYLYNLYYRPGRFNSFLKMLFLPIRGFVRGTSVIPGARILDIGCGSGQFLYEMKTLGMDVYGVEPGEINVASAKKERLNIINKTLEKAKYPNNFFDVITINHVLEHVNNPAGTIKEVYRILKKGGILIIGVPNFNCAEYRVFGRKWESLDIPRHLFDFSESILVKYLEKNKFKVSRVSYSGRADNLFPPLMSFLRNSSKNDKKSKKKNLFAHYTSALLTFIFSPLMNLFRVGSQIEIFCIKK